MSSNELIILKELKKILISNNPKDKDVVSLYDLSKLMNLKYEEYNKLIKSYKDYIDKKYNKNITNIKLNNFNYKKDAIILEINSKNHTANQLVAFTKQNDEFTFKSKNNNFDSILSLLKNDLKIMYNEFMKYHEFMTDEIYFKKSINSLFEFTIYNFCVFITYRNSIGLLANFDITYYNKNNSFDYYNDSKDILNIINGNEEKIFKKIFVNINDCPKWSRDILYNYRDMQVDNVKEKNLKIN